MATAPVILDPDIPVAIYASDMLLAGSTIDVLAVSVVAVIVPPMMLPTLDHVAAFADVRLLHATVPVRVGDTLKTLLPVPVASAAVAPVPPLATVSVPVVMLVAFKFVSAAPLPVMFLPVMSPALDQVAVAIFPTRLFPTTVSFDPIDI